VVHPEVGCKVPNEEVGPAEVLADLIQSSSDNQQSQIAQGNQVSVLGIIERAARVEVVDTAKETIFVTIAPPVALTLMLVVAGDVGEQVCRPAAELLVEKVESGGNGCLLGQLVELVNHLADSRGVVLAGLGDEDHVTLHVTGGLVVLAMGDLPGEVWNQEQGVTDPANSVVQDLAGRERLMTALMSQNPQTGTEQPLHEGVCSPETSSYGCGGDILGSDEAVGEVEDSS
jgi:hypothetical protein